MHVPPGGFPVAGQRQGALGSPRDAGSASFACGPRSRATTRGEPTVAGFDLLNEPVVTRAPGQWPTWPTRIAAAIRAVDPEHMLFVERLNAVGRRLEGGRGPQLLHHPRPEHGLRVPLLQAVPLHPPERVVGAVHGRERALPRRARRGRVVPARPQARAPTAARSCRRATRPGPSIRARRSGSTIRRSSSASRCWWCKRQLRHRVYFDDLVLEELAGDGAVKREIWRAEPDQQPRLVLLDARRQRRQPSPATAATATTRSLVRPARAATPTSAPTCCASAPSRARPTACPAGCAARRSRPAADCQIRLDFFSSRAPVQASDQTFLAQELDAYVAWGGAPQGAAVPGRVGRDPVRVRRRPRGPALGRPTCSTCWRARRVSIQLPRVSRGRVRPLPRPDGTLPDPANANLPLIELFTQKLGSRVRK